MVVPSLAWLAGSVALSALAVQQIVKPRLPVYTLQVQPAWPSARWRHGSLATRLHTSVALHNDNFMAIDVHKLTFDLFYMDWEGSLAHLGFVEDRHQVEANVTSSPPPLWKIAPRRNFAIVDDLYVATFVWTLIRSLPRLLWSLMAGKGSLWAPTTGVAHITTSE